MMQIEECSGVGAQVFGVNVASMSPEEEAAIKDAFAAHGVLYFRDQSITEDDHIAFANRWGEINVNRFFAKHPDFPQIAMVAKDVEDRDNIGGGWHTDHSYDVEPALGSILVARELPESGGDTRFASMYRAYETLPNDLKVRIEPLQAIHSAKHIFGTTTGNYYDQTDNRDTGRIENPDLADALQDVTHPVVITHPLSGKKALYVNPAFTVGIVGMEEPEAKSLLDTLYAHAVNQDNVYQLKWEPGTIAFWDNRATWHWALNDYHGQRRVMHRITVEGCALAA